ncbi:hypothetical protein R5R35_011125 [Gryllus longicercus]|uniref:Uncharacterized protein n=1 Tax=Gryllus longicercus TaxID=2509291 RepID=A0AAN9Z5C2_9ORTH
MEEHDAAEPFHIVYAEKFFKFLHSAHAFAQSTNNLAAQIQRIELVVQKVMTFVAFQQQLQQRCSFWKIVDTNDDSSSDSEEFTSSSTPQDKLNALSPKERFLDKDYLEIDSHDKQVLKEKLQSLNMSIVQVDVTPATEHHDNDCSNSCSTIGPGREHVCCTVRGVLQKGYDLNILLGVPSDKDENVSENTGQNVCASENQGFDYFKETAEDHTNRINDSGEEEAHSLGSLPGIVEGTDSDVLEQELSMNGDSKESCMQDLEQSAICEKIDKEDDGNNYWKNNCSHCLADNSGIHKDIESTNRNILDDNGSSNLEQVCHDLKEVAGNEFKYLDVREGEEVSNDLKGSDAFGNGSLVEAISTKNLGSEDNDPVLVNQCQQLSLVRASPDSGPTETNQGGDQLPNTFSNAFINGLQLIEFIHRKMGTFQWTNAIEASESEHEMKTDTFVQGCSINSESSVQTVADVKDSVGTVYLSSDSNSSNFTEPINNESNGVTTEYLEKNLEGQLLSDCTSESKDSTSANSRISSSTKEGKTCGETFSVQQGPHTICSADSAQPGEYERREVWRS